MAGGGVVALAVVAGIISGSLSAAAVTTLLADENGSPTNQTPLGTNVSQVHIDESSAVINAVNNAMPGGRQDPVADGHRRRHRLRLHLRLERVDPHQQARGRGAAEITVLLNDSRVFSGRVYGIDTLTDLAIVKIDATGLPVATLGSSEELQLGQLAIAIGNPLGNFENTVTTGVVSGLGRQIQAGDSTGSSSEQLNNLIQTDAAINPGNSGGPLINSAGQVIGINTAVNQDAQGIGFAIPISVARPIAELALAGKAIARPWIGVYYKLVDEQVADELGLSVDHGVLIDRPESGGPAIFAGSPADSAGLTEGDVVVAVDGDAVDADHDLVNPHPAARSGGRGHPQRGARWANPGDQRDAGNAPGDPLGAAPAANPDLDRLKGPGQRGLWLADADLDLVDRVRGEHGLGDRPGQRLEQVEGPLLDNLASQLEEGRIVDRVGELIGLGRHGKVEAHHQVDLERLLLRALLGPDAVPAHELHPAQGDPVASAPSLIGATARSRRTRAPSSPSPRRRGRGRCQPRRQWPGRRSRPFPPAAGRVGRRPGAHR